MCNVRVLSDDLYDYSQKKVMTWNDFTNVTSSYNIRLKCLSYKLSNLTKWPVFHQYFYATYPLLKYKYWLIFQNPL